MMDFCSIYNFNVSSISFLALMMLRLLVMNFS